MNLKTKSLMFKAEKQRLTLILFATMVLLLFVLIYLLNRIYPLSLDDWDYSFIHGASELKKVSSISDIFISQYNHYFSWGGRSVVHFIAQFLLMQKIWVMDLLNTMAYVICLIFMYRISNINKKTNCYLFFYINLAFWFLLPEFSSSVFWIVGSSNYLWGSLLRIVFLFPFCVYFINTDDRKYRDTFIKCILFFVFGIIAGWTNENTALGMLFLLACLLIYLKMNKQPIPKWFLFGLLGAIVGYVIMFVAPGNFVRAGNATGGQSLFRPMFLLGQTYNLLKQYIFSFLFIYGVYTFLFVVVYKQQKKEVNRYLYLSFFFLLAGTVSILAMIPSPNFPLTVWTGIYSFIIIALGILLANINFREKSLYLNFITLLALVFFVYSYVSLYQKIDLFSDLMDKRVKEIEQQKAEGSKDIAVHNQIDIDGVFSKYWDVTEFTDRWQNNAYTKYFDINTIVYKPDSIKD